MLSIVLSIIIAAAALCFLKMLPIGEKKVREYAYLWWRIPIVAVLFILLAALIFHLCNLTDLSHRMFPKMDATDYEIETIYVLLCMAIWTVAGIIRTTSRKIQKTKNSANGKLRWPYFSTAKGTDGVARKSIRSRVGRRFYLRILKMMILLVAGLYILALIAMTIVNYTHFILLTVLPLLSIIPMAEAYIYLMAEVPEEEHYQEVKKTETPSQEDDLEELWQIYADTFDNYSVAWRSYASPINNEDSVKVSNDVRPLLLDDYIIEDTDLVTAFSKIEPLFTAVENSGRYIFVALDVPEHFKLNKKDRYLDAIADSLSKIISKKVVAFRKEFSTDKLENSVVVAPLSLLLGGRLSAEWLQRLGMITIVDIHDRGVANLYECREFSFILRNENPDCRLLFLSPKRMGLQPSLKSTWASDIDIKEDTLRLMPNAKRFFFIGFDVENFCDRFDTILSAWPAEPLYPGSELAPIAVSSAFKGNNKKIWPPHYFDVAYSNFAEGMEELKKSTLSFKPDMLKISAESIKEKALCHHLPIDNINESQMVSVIYDQENNAPAAYLRWVHLGDEENFSMVLSKPYLFRDYFNANHSFFCDHSMLSLQPHLSDSRITLAIMLFNMLLQTKKEENEIRRLLIQYYDEGEIISVPAIVSELFQRYFGNDLVRSLSTEMCSCFNGVQYRHQIFYTINADRFHKPDYLNRIAVVDTTGNTLFEISQDLLFQNYDKGQIHSFNGRPYKIGNFSKVDHTLQVSATSDSSNILFYRACREVKLSEKMSFGETSPTNTLRWRHRLTGQDISLGLKYFETEMSITTTEWYQFSRYSVMGNDCVRMDACSPTRIYKNGKVLRMDMNFLRKKEYLSRKEDIRRSLLILLTEAMQTFFPHHAQYLVIASVGDSDKDLPWIFPTFKTNGTEEDGCLSLYFIEDANIDLGLIGSLTQNGAIRYIFEYLYDYLCWLTESDSFFPKYFPVYKTRPSGLDHLEYLRYGRQSLPGYFDIDLLLNFIRDFFDKVSIRHDNRLKYLATTESGSQFQCDFCEKEFDITELTQLSDGRMRCHECSIDAIDTDAQFQELCNIAKSLFLTHLGIDFNTIPHKGNLISAVELHSKGNKPFSLTNGFDARKILGIAFDKAYDEFFVEDGRKPLSTLGIICHEMTHIWQYNAPEFVSRCNDPKWMEGLAVWTDLFLTSKYGAEDMEIRKNCWLAQNDEYGNGLRMIYDLCPDNPYEYIRNNQ